MTTPRNPFAKSRARPGEGNIVLSLLPPNKQVLTTFEYQYPLKLISPDPHKVTVKKPEQDASQSDSQTIEVPVTTVFLLTYGGGLLASDSISLAINVEPHTRLALLTQGSTKIFKTQPATPSVSQISAFATRQVSATRQILNVKISPHASLCYLPDPNQPFAESVYEQRQTFYVDPFGSSSLIFLDWVSEGRSARGERWTLTSWKGRNEVREFDENSKGRLLVRDALLLESEELALKTDGKGILGTLVIYGPMFKSLADYFVNEFKHMPRIGGKNWTSRPKTPIIVEEAESGDYFSKTRADSTATGNLTPGGERRIRIERTKEEEAEGLLWTAAQVRGFVLVKFGAAEVDGARRWLASMLKREGSVEREFGHQALLCLR